MNCGNGNKKDQDDALIYSHPPMAGVLKYDFAPNRKNNKALILDPGGMVTAY